MSGTGSSGDLVALLTLRRTRSLVHGAFGRTVAVSIGIIYGFLALLTGLMLQFGPTGSTKTTFLVVNGGSSPDWWNFPALFVVFPNGVIALPFFATISMVVVAAGVGLGMGAGILLAIRLLRARRQARLGTGAASSLAGLTPAMVALLTLGACCSTSAAAAAGIGAVAQASGTTYYQLLANSWYLNVFQMAVLAVALLAQEQLLVVYGDLFGGFTPTRSAATVARSRPFREVVPVFALRTLLVAAGAVWTVSFLLLWALPGPFALYPGPGPGAGQLAVEFLQKPFLGLTVLAAALSPAAFLGVASRRSLRGLVPVYRTLLLLCGVSLAVGVPPPLTGWGVGGLGNQLLGAAGVPESLGGAAPPPLSGWPLALSWLVFYALLGLIAIVLALRPARLLRYFSDDRELDPPGPRSRTETGTLDPGTVRIDRHDGPGVDRDRTGTWAPQREEGGD